MISVLIIGNVRLYREGLELALSRDGRFEVVESAPCQREALVLARRLCPDVVLVDLAMPGGIEAVEAVRAADGLTTIVALAVRDADDDILACAEAGAAAYVTRDRSLEELLDTVSAAVRGELHCSPRIAATLFRRVCDLSQGRNSSGRTPSLSSREFQVLDLIERGYSNKQIARDLGIEVTTAKNHVHRVLAKLKVRRRGEAAAMARRLAPR